MTPDPTRDSYEVLGVERDAGARAIEQAFRERAKRRHPDRELRERLRRLRRGPSMPADCR